MGSSGYCKTCNSQSVGEAIIIGAINTVYTVITTFNLTFWFPSCALPQWASEASKVPEAEEKLGHWRDWSWLQGWMDIKE